MKNIEMQLLFRNTNETVHCKLKKRNMKNARVFKDNLTYNKKLQISNDQDQDNIIYLNQI